jgi:four helix bundle protein
MTEEQFKARTRRFALDSMKFVATLERDMVATHIGKQLLRCATSVGANYRAACRGRSTADMVAKLGIVEEEADEAIYWIGLLRDWRGDCQAGSDLEREATEILSMTVSSIKTLRARPATAPIQNPKSKIQN